MENGGNIGRSTAGGFFEVKVPNNVYTKNLINIYGAKTSGLRDRLIVP